MDTNENIIERSEYVKLSRYIVELRVHDETKKISIRRISKPFTFKHTRSNEQTCYSMNTYSNYIDVLKLCTRYSVFYFLDQYEILNINFVYVFKTKSVNDEILRFFATS